MKRLMTVLLGVVMAVAGCHRDDDDDAPGGSTLVPGSLVAGFGTGGAVTLNSSAGNESIDGFATEGNNLYAVGYDSAPGNNQWRIEKRLLSTGEPVQGFGTGGVVTSNPSANSDSAIKVAIDGSWLFIVGVENYPADGPGRIEKRSLATGALDPAFGVGGVVTSNPTANSDYYTDIAIGSPWMYLIGIASDNVGDPQLWIEKRSLATGALDAAFGVGGIILVNPTGARESGHAIVLDSANDALFVGGISSSTDWRIEKRLMSTGALIAAFGTGGVVTVATGGDSRVLHFVLDSGSLYAAGWQTLSQWRIEKRNAATGALDTSFDGDGVVLSDPAAGDDRAFEALLFQGRLYVAGLDNVPGNNRWRVECRSAASGALDASFGTGGVQVSDPSGGSDELHVLVEIGGSLYGGGFDSAFGNQQWRIEKRNALTGALDADFGTGFVVSNPSGGNEFLNVLGSDATSVYAAGSDAAPGNDQWRIEKRDRVTGALDTAFGTGGIVQNNPSAGADAAHDLALDAGFLYLVGWDSSPGNDQWRIEKRSLSTGALDPGFGAGGVVTSNPTGGGDRAWGVAIDTLSMYVVGYDSTGTDQLRIEKRSLTTGALDPAFGVGGVLASNPSGGSDMFFDAAIDGAFLFVVGRDGGGAGLQGRIEKRATADGALDPGFGAGGVVLIDASAGNDEAGDIVTDGAYLYVGGYDNTAGNAQIRIEKRLLATGVLDPGFGTGGVVTQNASAAFDAVVSLGIDGSALYVAGQVNVGVDPQWRIQKRSASTGALDPTFGEIVSNFSSGDDRPWTLVAASDALFIGGWESQPGNQQWRIEKRAK